MGGPNCAARTNRLRGFFSCSQRLCIQCAPGRRLGIPWILGNLPTRAGAAGRWRLRATAFTAVARAPELTGRPAEVRLKVRYALPVAAMSGTGHDSNDIPCTLVGAPVFGRFPHFCCANFRPDSTAFITTDLKLFNDEKVERLPHCRAFQARTKIGAFQPMHECRQLSTHTISLT